ncbi:MAG: sigma-E processing peptidase SpoIIGA [Oscillospiraceae bacterium]
MKIYVDVLIIVNAIITLIYIQCISRMTHRKTTPKRELLCALTGGIGSLSALINSSSFGSALIVTLIKLAAITLITAAAFAPFDLSGFIKLLFLYILCELLMGGLCFLIVNIAHSPIVCIKNYTVYFDVSLIQIALCCSAVYLIIIIYETITRKCSCTVKKYKATYICGKYEITLPALADTGNKLCDSFTGTPVVIFRSNELYEHFSLDRIEQQSSYGFRPIPYETINGCGVIYITSKGTVRISGGEFSKNVDCCVGVLPHDKSSYAIFDPMLLI